MDKMRRALWLVCLMVFASAQTAAAADATPCRSLPTDRGRVWVDHSLGHPRLLTDQGTLLRGVFVSWDGDRRAIPLEEVPSEQELEQLATVYGLNAVHVYLEKYNTNPDGSLNGGANQPACDLLVDRCSKAGLYVIITIGNGNRPDLNGYFYSMQFAHSFWSVYAPRYRDRTHVIYEIHNEPGPEIANIEAIMNAPSPEQAPPRLPPQPKFAISQWTPKVLANELALYQTIRRHAPDSHVMLFSPSCFNSPIKAREFVDYATQQQVDWSKASFAIHGYGLGLNMEPVIRDFLYAMGNPAALTCTEPEGMVDEVPAFERHSVGWCLFVPAVRDNLERMQQEVTRKSIAWQPERGTWPGTQGLPIGQVVRLKSAASGKWLVTDSESELPVTARGAQEDDPYNRFLVVSMFDRGLGLVALKSVMTNHYLMADYNNPDRPPLRCVVDTPAVWESFRWTPAAGKDGAVMLQSMQNGRFVQIDSAAGDSQSLTATAEKSGAADTVLYWEAVAPRPSVAAGPE